MNSLEHHGVKGMKWGVRRYQNADGTLTALGRKQKVLNSTKRTVLKTESDVQSIVDTMTDKERKMLGLESQFYMEDDELEKIMKRFVARVGDTPVAFLDVRKSYKGAGSVSIGSRNEEKYRRKGYASDLVKQAQKWLETPEAKDVLKLDTLVWFARRENIPSRSLAQKNEFKDWQKYRKDPEWWAGRYSK